MTKEEKIVGQCKSSVSKELEAKTEDISKLLYEVYDVPSGICEYIEKELQRLEAIDNAKPSEALECLEWVIKNYIGNDYYVYEEELITIKQTLLKAQEQEKVLEIIKEKNVDIWTLKESENLAQYNFSMASKKYNLVNKMGFKTQIFYLEQEEFDLLKRSLN